MPNSDATKTTTMAVAANQATIWPSQKNAEFVYDLANFALIAALALGVVATILIVWMGNKKEEYLKRDLSSAALRAAEAIQKAEEEHLARVKIEERLAPRTLLDEQLESIFAAISPYQDVSIDALQFGETPEIATFLALLVTPMQRAGWSPRVWTVPGGPAVVGVHIGARVGATESELAALEALRAALAREGIEAGTFSFNRGKQGNWPGFVMGPPYSAEKEAPLRLVVGAKP